MSTKEEVLKILENSRGSAVSGAEIAQRLCVSRSAVWKAINRLKQDGHAITAVTNKGYTLTPESSAVSSPGIESLLSTPCRLRILNTVTSTNDEAKRLAEDGAKEWTVVIAKEQTAGKGRLGRSFYSPPGSGIYMSIVLRPAFSAQQSLLITTAAAVAVAQALEECGCPRADIKWVNDVYTGGKKVCGILTEGSFDFETGLLSYAVLGIGINLSAPDGGFPHELKDKAGWAFSGDIPLPNRIIASVIDNFAAYYERLTERPHLEGYKSRCMLTGRNVLVHSRDSLRPALVLGIDDDFRLLVRYGDGSVEALSSAEVSVTPEN
ncbi:MAG: biotin--[Oscillospiraceae bacterium]|nr:biotin--[acetyl-CoA-carboxylase] ligase [Oscillospiraceae bacterium]